MKIRRQFTEMPHYFFGDSFIDLESEMYTKLPWEEFRNRLIAIAAGLPVESKSGGTFQLTSRSERLAFVAILNDDAGIQLAIKKYWGESLADLLPDLERAAKS